jgi:lipopolysaccharide biosynthesis protein
MKLCFFVMYSPTGELQNYRKVYIEELSVHARVIVLAVERLDLESQNYLANRRIAYRIYPNEGHDFGAWYRAINEEENKIQIYDDILMVNDSCVPVKRLHNFFQWSDKNNFDFYGLTANSQISTHIQSYFFGWRQKITNTVKEYFNVHGIVRSGKQDVINIYEVGLSDYLRKKKIRMWAQYPVTISTGHSLPDYGVPFLLDRGFPLIKKSVICLFANYLQDWSDYNVNYLLDGVCDLASPGFDENFYLETYPDVKKMIDNKSITCGFEHYRRLGGQLEGRIANKEGVPLPIF